MLSGIDWLLAHVPDDSGIIHPLIALAFALLLHLAAAGCARFIGPRLQPRAQVMGPAFALRLRAMLRYAISALMIGIAAASIKCRCRCCHECRCRCLCCRFLGTGVLPLCYFHRT